MDCRREASKETSERKCRIIIIIIIINNNYNYYFSISPNKKKKIKTANNNVEEISKKIKELRNELVKAEKELDIAVGKKVRANTNDTLGDDGSMSIENANILEELKETLSCSICLDAYSQKNNIWSTGCGHLYHKRCINACINVSKIRYSPKPTPGSRSRH